MHRLETGCRTGCSLGPTSTLPLRLSASAIAAIPSKTLSTSLFLSPSCLVLCSVAGNKIGDDGITALVQATHLVFGLGEYNLSLKELQYVWLFCCPGLPFSPDLRPTILLTPLCLLYSVQKNKCSKKTRKALAKDIPDDSSCHVKF